eukprot:1157440-Pelagomonas_calceolata.AAC.3
MGRVGSGMFKDFPVTYRPYWLCPQEKEGKSTPALKTSICGRVAVLQLVGVTGEPYMDPGEGDLTSEIGSNLHALASLLVREPYLNARGLLASHAQGRVRCYGAGRAHQALLIAITALPQTCLALDGQARGHQLVRYSTQLLQVGVAGVDVAQHAGCVCGAQIGILQVKHIIQIVVCTSAGGQWKGIGQAHKALSQTLPEDIAGQAHFCVLASHHACQSIEPTSLVGWSDKLGLVWRDSTTRWADVL